MMNKKILLTIPSLEFGGAERVTTYLAQYFTEQGYSVRVITSKPESENEYKLGKHIERISLENRKTRGCFRRIRNLRREIKVFSPEIVVIMFAPMGLFVIPALAGLHIPCIISERNDPKNFAGKKIVAFLYQYFIRFADGLVLQTEDAREFYSKKFHKKRVVIPNPVFTELLPDPFQGKREHKIVSVGRLHYQKNHKLLLEAFREVLKKHPDYRLEIYGEGELRQELEAYVKKCGLEKYVFLPGSCQEVLMKINNAELFVMTSDFEGMPNALIEAMALGLPVVSTDCPCGGPKFLIRNGINGILVPVKNKAELVGAILELLENKELAERLSKNALKIREDLGEKKIGAKWLQFCNEIAEIKG